MHTVLHFIALQLHLAELQALIHCCLQHCNLFRLFCLACTGHLISCLDLQCFLLAFYLSTTYI